MELSVPSTDTLEVLLKRLTPDNKSFSYKCSGKNKKQGTFVAGVSPFISGTWTMEKPMERRRRESKSLLDMDND